MTEQDPQNNSNNNSSYQSLLELPELQNILLHGRSSPPKINSERGREAHQLPPQQQQQQNSKEPQRFQVAVACFVNSICEFLLPEDKKAAQILIMNKVAVPHVQTLFRCGGNSSNHNNNAAFTLQNYPSENEYEECFEVILREFKLGFSVLYKDFTLGLKEHLIEKYYEELKRQSAPRRNINNNNNNDTFLGSNADDVVLVDDFVEELFQRPRYARRTNVSTIADSRGYLISVNYNLGNSKRRRN